MPIAPKEKPCKGIGKAHGFEGCGTVTLYRTHGLCMQRKSETEQSCYAKWLSVSKIGNEKVSKTAYEVQKPRLELEKAQKERDTSKSLKNALKATKTIVHEYIRLRDKGKPCVSCGEPWREDFQACHYHKAELYETLKFNLDNIHGGCIGCNIHKDGNLEQYNINLPLRIGKERFDELQRLAQIDKHYSKVWNLENLKEIRVKIRQLIKELDP